MIGWNGFRRKDIILQVNETLPGDFRALRDMVQALGSGSEINFSVMRGEERITITVTTRTMKKSSLGTVRLKSDEF